MIYRQLQNVRLEAGGSESPLLASTEEEEEFQPSWSPAVTGGKPHYSDNSHFSNDLQLLIRDKDSYDGKAGE